MNKDAALARLAFKAQASSDPQLTPTELEAILGLYALADSAGLPPSDPAWVGTWQWPSAYREAWLAKAAKCVGDVTYSVDGASYNTSDMHAHCMTMANSFTTIGSFSVGASDATDE